MTRVIDFLKRTASSWVPSLLGSLIVCVTLAYRVDADPFAPFGGFGSGNVATSQSGCSDLGAGLGIVNNVQVCIPASIGEAITLTAASTAFTVNNNATIGGLLTLSGSGTALSVTNNATISGTLTSGAINASGEIADSASGLGLAVTNNATVGGTLGITGTTSAAAINASGVYTATGSSPQIVLGSTATSTVEEIDSQSVTAPGLIIAEKGGSGMGGTAINVRVQGTNTGTTDLLDITGAGDVDAQGNLRAQGTGVGEGEVESDNANMIAGALRTGAHVIGGTGPIATDTSCGNTTPISTSGKAATMTNSVSCAFKVIAADVAGPFAIAYPHTYNTAPLCYPSIQVNTNSDVIKSCLDNGSKTGVTLTFTGSVGTNDVFNILLVGGK